MARTAGRWQATLKLAAALDSRIPVALQLPHILRRQLELHIHHMSTNSQVDGQR